MKHQFRNDYSELGHERVLNAINKYANEQNIGYGLDYHSINAEKLIKEKFGVPKANVHFIAGGTQANMVLISGALRPYEAVICADTGHINVHETGAVEASGHKIITIKNTNGKISAKDVKETFAKFTDEHMVKPALVYISNSTETGSIYLKKELEDLRRVCDELGLYLFIDGARLAVALTSEINDIEASEFGKYADVFYVGGTKNGLLLGEALVINNPNLQKYFRYHIKNRGAMLAKGFLLGIQFEEVFKDNLYFELGFSSNKMAKLIRLHLEKSGFNMLDSRTNQLFIELPNKVAYKLIEEYGCEKWEDKAENTVIRIVTSFSTKEEDVKELLDSFDRYTK